MFRSILERHIKEGAFPGAALTIYKDGCLWEETYCGTLTYEEERSVNAYTRYDLASVTKVYTSACVALLLERGELSLGQPAVSVLPELTGTDKESITILQLCTHTAGLFGDPKLHKRAAGREALTRRFFDEPLKSPPARHVFYTSVGYQYLGLIIERISRMRLSGFMDAYLFKPLNTRTAGYNPGNKDNIAPTEYSIFRGYICRGEVHDDNCYVLGGICGHAGLFATARDVAVFGGMLLTGAPVFKNRESLAPLFTNYTEGLEQSRSIGFVIDDEKMGRWKCPAYHHTGFTGTSLFLAPKHRLACVLLTNRVYPTRENEKIQAARLDVHAALAKMFGESAD